MRKHYTSTLEAILAIALVFSFYTFSISAEFDISDPNLKREEKLATEVFLSCVQNVFTDRQDNIFFSGSKIYRVDSQTGLITTLAVVDNPETPKAELAAICEDKAGNIFFSGWSSQDGDSSIYGIHRIDSPTGIVTILLDREIDKRYDIFADDIFVDSDGNLFMTESYSNVVKRIKEENDDIVVTIVAGNGEKGFSGDGGSATQASLASPRGIYVDYQGNLFIADTNNNRVRRVDAQTNIITTVVGNGEERYSGDGGLATKASLNHPSGVFIDDLGNLFIADSGNNCIRLVDGQTGIITTVAGNGEAGYSIDGRLATKARLNHPHGVFVDNRGNLFIADSNNRLVRKVDAQTEIITTVAGAAGVPLAWGWPTGIFGDSDGNLYVGSHPNPIIYTPFDIDANYSLHKIAGESDITVVGVSGLYGFSGDGGLAVEANVAHITDIFVDVNGNIFFSQVSDIYYPDLEDPDYSRIRRIDAQTGIITTVAGGGTKTGDNILPTQARLSHPIGVFLDGDGNIFFAEKDNHSIRRVDAQTGIITTVVGGGEAGYSGDGGLAVEARLNQPSDVFIDNSGNLFIADTGNNCIRRVDSQTGIITTIQADLNEPTDIFIDGQGDLFIVSSGNRIIQRMDGQTGKLTAIESIRWSWYADIFVNSEGNLFVAAEDRGLKKVEIGGPLPGILKGVTPPDGSKILGNTSIEVEFYNPVKDCTIAGKKATLKAGNKKAIIDNAGLKEGWQGVGIEWTNKDGSTEGRFVDYIVKDKEVFPWDVNSDGKVDIFDLVLVGKQFGEEGDEVTGDVNSDGEVNIFDLVQVGSHFGEKTAAPSITNISLFQQIYDILKTVPNPNQNLKLALIELKKLLVPSETKLLQSYPNPGNPETWIPFQLAEEATILIIIYDASGRKVRTLFLGERPAGVYVSKEKAAHWDGRNDEGEKVASGVYWYTLQAGEEGAIRRMVILK